MLFLQIAFKLVLFLVSPFWVYKTWGILIKNNFTRQVAYLLHCTIMHKINYDYFTWFACENNLTVVLLQGRKTKRSSFLLQFKRSSASTYRVLLNRWLPCRCISRYNKLIDILKLPNRWSRTVLYYIIAVKNL